MKLLNWAEINRQAGKITTTGQIEKTIDVQEKWYTVNELIDFIRSKFTVNNNYTNSVKIIYDEKNNINIGDRIVLNLEEYFSVGNFVITDIRQSKSGNEPFTYELELRNTNLLENYIDLFRAIDKEEQEEQTQIEYVVEYAEEEMIVESHTIEIEGNDKDSTLNFKLR